MYLYMFIDMLTYIHNSNPYYVHNFKYFIKDFAQLSYSLSPQLFLLEMGLLSPLQIFQEFSMSALVVKETDIEHYSFHL
jgi:hypothetical protein